MEAVGRPRAGPGATPARRARGRRARSSSSASWARARRARRAAAAAALGRRGRSTWTTSSSGSSASRSRPSSTARARPPSARARRSSASRCSPDPTPAWWPSAAARCSPTRCARRCATTPSCTSTWSPTTRGTGRPASGRPLARDRAPLRPAPRATAARLRVGRRRRPPAAGPRDLLRRALPALDRPGTRAPPAAPASCGRQADVGRLPGFVGAGAPRGAASSTRTAGGASSSPTRRRARAGRSIDVLASPGRVRGAAGRERSKTLARAEEVLREHGARGDRARRPAGRVRAAGWWATSGASARRSTSAGCAACRCPTTLRGPGRLGLRRQDRRRPARGQELRRRLHQPARRARRPRRCSLTLPDAEERAAGYAEVVKTALIAGGRAVGARARRRPSPTRSDRAAACAPSSRWSRRTSATRVDARSSTSATPSRTRSRRPPATGATPRGGGRARAAVRAAALGAGGAQRRRSPTSSPRTACRPPSKPSRPTRCWR